VRRPAGTRDRDADPKEDAVKKTLYAGLGLVAWKLGKRYLRRRIPF
jgi:hypothetical protein